MKQAQRHPEVRALRASKDGRISVAHPSRFAEDGSHLRMTIGVCDAVMAMTTQPLPFLPALKARSCDSDSFCSPR